MDNTNSRAHLRELHGSGYEIVDGQPNIIGWTIKDVNNHRIGVVDDLLFDQDQQKVRYIIANLKDNHFDLDKRKVLIPIGIAELHETDDDVLVPQVSAWQLRALPTYTDRMTDRDEQEVYTVFSTPSASTQATGVSDTWQKPNNFYEHSYFDHDHMFNKRRKSGSSQQQPIQRSVRRREGFVESDTSTGRAGSNDFASSRHSQESHAMAASDYSGSGSDDSRYRNDQSNEKLLTKIKRMQSELDEIERDLRNNNRNI